MSDYVAEKIIMRKRRKEAKKLTLTSTKYPGRVILEEGKPPTLTHAAGPGRHLGSTLAYGRDVVRINACALRHSGYSCSRISKDKETADV